MQLFLLIIANILAYMSIFKKTIPYICVTLYHFIRLKSNK